MLAIRKAINSALPFIGVGIVLLFVATVIWLQWGWHPINLKSRIDDLEKRIEKLETK